MVAWLIACLLTRGFTTYSIKVGLCSRRVLRVESWAEDALRGLSDLLCCDAQWRYEYLRW